MKDVEIQTERMFHHVSSTLEYREEPSRVILVQFYSRKTIQNQHIIPKLIVVDVWDRMTVTIQNDRIWSNNEETNYYRKC